MSWIADLIFMTMVIFCLSDIEKELTRIRKKLEKEK